MSYSYTSPYTSPYTYNSNLLNNTYIPSGYYLTNANGSYSCTFTGDIGSTYHITNSANGYLDGSYTLTGDIGGTYTQPAIWQSQYPVQEFTWTPPDGFAIDPSYVSQPPVDQHLSSIYQSMVDTILDRCSDCLGTGALPLNLVEPTCCACNGTGRAIKKSL